MASEEPKLEGDAVLAALADIRRELKTIREGLGKALFAIHDAEAEVPEKMRRFMMFGHDLHDIAYMYEVRGLPVPPYIHREMERFDDRLRQLLGDANAPGGAFEKVRREMAKDPENRWDHTKLLSGTKETKE